MNFLKAIRADLVDKRLWPLVALLIIAAAAVPVVVPKLGDSGSSVPPVRPAAADSAAAGLPSTQPVSVVTDSAWAQHPHGHYHDPFRTSESTAAAATPGAPKAPHTPAAAPTAKPSAPATATVPVPPATSVPVRTTTPVTPAATTGVLAGYRVDVRWGPTDRTSEHQNIPRLTGLRAGALPVVAFLGVRAGGQVAVFLVRHVPWVLGEGACRPSKTACETVELRVGQTELLNVPSDPRRPYVLRVTRLSEKRTATAAQAKAFRRRKAKTGATMRSDAIAAGEFYVSRYVYDWARGVLTLDKHSMLAGNAKTAPTEGSPGATSVWSAGSTTGQ